MVQYEPDEPLISQNTSILTQKNNQQVAKYYQLSVFQSFVHRCINVTLVTFKQ